MAAPPDTIYEENLTSDKAIPQSCLDWEARVKGIGVTGMVKQLALNCEWLKRDGKQVYFRVDAQHAHFLNEVRRKDLENALSKSLSEDLQLHIENAAGQLQHTPARIQQRRREERFKQAEEAIKTDTALRQLIEVFNADITPGSIQPLDEQTE